MLPADAVFCSTVVLSTPTWARLAPIVCAEATDPVVSEPSTLTTPFSATSVRGTVGEAKFELTRRATAWACVVIRGWLFAASASSV